jgi:hypothetical protein
VSERPDPPASDHQRIGGRAARVGALAILAIFALALGSALGTFAWRASGGEDEGETITVRGGTDVVAAVRDLARLESASYHMERVIELTSTQRRVFGLVEAEDSILLVAAADVYAGVDLSEIRDGDVTVDRTAWRAEIVLPPPRVLQTRIDSEHTYVHSRSTDILAQRREELETEARREAERTLEASAIEAGILDRARENARRTVGALVRSLGYTEVTVRFRDGGDED